MATVYLIVAVLSRSSPHARRMGGARADTAQRWHPTDARAIPINTRATGEMMGIARRDLA
jgi:hypothetical protein